jgi:two-component system, NtrC family, sensor kinase
MENKILTQLINNCIGDPCYVKDREHKFMLVNDAFCSFFGSRPDGFLGKLRLDSMPEEVLNPILQEEEEVFRSGKGKITED